MSALFFPRAISRVLCSISCLLSLSTVAQADLIWDQFKTQAEQISDHDVKSWTLMQSGRLKPFDSLSREASIFVTGSYHFRGLNPIQLLLGLMSFENAADLDVIEVRSPELRTELQLPKERRFFSLKELRSTKLEAEAGPLLEKQKVNKRTLTELENKALEAREQMFAFENIQSGGILVEAMEPGLQEGHVDAEHSPVINDLKLFMRSLINHEGFEQTRLAKQIDQELILQKWPEALRSQVPHIPLEVFYNSFHPFRWACGLFFLVACLFLIPKVAGRPSPQVTGYLSLSVMRAIAAIPLLVLIWGFAIRVTITGMAPVTNMYGTMVWVSQGIGLIGFIFYLIYKNQAFLSIIYFGSFVLLFITDQIPLIISPDMDPIVAVLRSNLWLTIHVLTITMSYAAFSLAMLLGNTMLVRELLRKNNVEWIKTYSHYCYRAIQFGVFLLSVGIILGGVWADYSWGRFWGWDPKETWALIADLGFLSLLHARFAGWMDSHRLLLFSPLAYLLVVMAWYGVNFILATGLHSYGFSSGGARIVSIFVGVQILLIASNFIMGHFRSKGTAAL